MRKLFFLPVLALMFACGGEGSEETAGDFNYELSYDVDTVMVDAGDHFFFLNWGMGIADVSSDAKTLYNLNPNSLLLEIVDLDQMKLKTTVQLEREGPNGVGGGFIGRLQVLDNGNIKLFDFNAIFEVNQQGELVDKFEYEKSEWTGYEITEEEQFEYYGTFSPDGKLFFTKLSEQGFGEPAKGILKADMEAKTLELLDAGDMFERLDKFSITMRSGDGTMMMTTGESVHTDFVNGDFVITNAAFNEALVWQSQSDSLSQKNFNSSLTSNEKTGDFPSEVDSQEALMEIMQKKQELVEFEGMIYHPEENLIWRFAEDKDRMIADSVIKKQVVTLFDTDYNMVHEQKIEDYPNASMRFFKDGMLYTYVNIDDEMAFARIKPKGEEGSGGSLVRTD